MAYKNPRLGETGDHIVCKVPEYAPGTDVITGVKASVRRQGSASLLRDEAIGASSGERAYYLESFTAANGYAGGAEYTALLEISIVRGGATFVLRHEDTFMVLPAIDE